MGKSNVHRIQSCQARKHQTLEVFPEQNLDPVRVLAHFTTLNPSTALAVVPGRGIRFAHVRCGSD